MVIDSYGKENVIGYSINVNEICDALRSLVYLHNLKNVKNTDGGVSLY